VVTYRLKCSNLFCVLWVMATGEGQKLSEEGHDDSLVEGRLSAVALKVPPFYTGNPAVWFIQLEAQFGLANIKASTTKYHHVVSKLPEEVAVNVLTGADMGSNYAVLKQRILSIYQKSRSVLMQEILDQNLSLGGQKPSVFVIKLMQKFRDCGVVPDDELVKLRLLHCLPVTVRLALSAHLGECKVTELAAKADEMMNFVGDAVCSFVGGTSSGFTGQPVPVAAATVPEAAVAFVGDADIGVRPFRPGQRPVVCRSHLYFGMAATSCQPWCVWPKQRDRFSPSLERGGRGGGYASGSGMRSPSRRRGDSPARWSGNAQAPQQS
jgi:hypothetical protein